MKLYSVCFVQLTATKAHVFVGLAPRVTVFSKVLVCMRSQRGRDSVLVF